MKSLLLQPAQPGATSTSTPTPSPAGDASNPAGGGGGLFGGMGSMLFLLLPILLIFWMTRSQNKKQKQLEESLKVGDRVVTRAGMIGKITKIGDKTTEIEIAPGVFVAFLKTSIEGKDAADPKADTTKDGDAKKGSDAKKEPDAKKDEKESQASKPSGKDKSSGKEATSP